MGYSDSTKAVRSFCLHANIEAGTALEQDVAKMLAGEMDETGCSAGEAYDRMREWYEEAGNYGLEDFDTATVVAFSPAETRKFVGSHRRACVWAVLLGLERGN